MACACLLAAAASAQTGGTGEGGRKPSEPTRPFVVMTAQSLAEFERQVRGGGKADDLHGGAGTQLRVAVVHERDKPAAVAEIHDASDDVYYVLEGAATLTLGGRLEAPRETEAGEWRGPSISGGRTVEIRKGDLVVVPRGTPHSRSTAGREFSMLLVKVWAAPQGVTPPSTPAATPTAGQAQTRIADERYSAVVKRDSARFTLPVPERARWRWRMPQTREGSQEYRMDVSVENGAMEYTFGFYLWKPSGSRGAGEGVFADLIRAGQRNVFVRPPGTRIHGIVRDAEVSLTPMTSQLLIEVHGRENVERLFSARPAEVTFRVNLPDEAPVTKTVPVRYQD